MRLQGVSLVCARQFTWGGSVKRCKHFARCSAERKMSPKISPFLFAGWPLKLFFCGFHNVRETYWRLRIDRSRQNSFSFHVAAPSCEGNKALWALLGVIAVASCGIRLILRLRSLQLLLRGAATAPCSTLVFPALSSG